MKVLVDMSAWVEFLNGNDSPEQAAVRKLLEGEDDVCTCGVVVAEVFQGLRRDRGRAEISGFFRQLTFLEPEAIDVYLHAAELYRALRQHGVTVRSTIDCLIAVIAERNGCLILSRDRDIDAIVRSGMLQTGHWQPPTR